MIRISFLTLAEKDAVELAAFHIEHHLLTFDTLEDHVDLLWDGDKPERRHLTHLSGITQHCTSVRLSDQHLNCWEIASYASGQHR